MSNRVDRLLAALLNGETADITPQSRVESYLKACLNGLGTEGLPTPQSTTDVYLYALVEKFTGGGPGGDSTNYITCPDGYKLRVRFDEGTTTTYTLTCPHCGNSETSYDKSTFWNEDYGQYWCYNCNEGLYESYITEAQVPGVEKLINGGESMTVSSSVTVLDLIKVSSGTPMVYIPYDGWYQTLEEYGSTPDISYTCPNCGTTHYLSGTYRFVEDGHNYCPSCQHSPLAPTISGTCQDCGSLVEDVTTSDWCPHCGAPVNWDSSGSGSGDSGSDTPMVYIPYDGWYQTLEEYGSTPDISYTCPNCGTTHYLSGTYRFVEDGHNYCPSCQHRPLAPTITGTCQDCGATVEGLDTSDNCPNCGYTVTWEGSGSGDGSTYYYIEEWNEDFGTTYNWTTEEQSGTVELTATCPHCGTVHKSTTQSQDAMWGMLYCQHCGESLSFTTRDGLHWCSSIDSFMDESEAQDGCCPNCGESYC